MLVIMESVYVLTRQEVWRTITRFWGTLFGINFVLGVATGLTMEFEFGMNWSYYSHYVGDIFGAPLAIEGLMAFFLEATMVGLMFFGWEKLSRPGHLLVTFLVALGTNLSALWILIANGWMQYPVGAHFNAHDHAHGSHRLHGAVLFNPGGPGQVRPYRVSAGYVTGFGVRARRHQRHGICCGAATWVSIARRSMTVAASLRSGIQPCRWSCWGMSRGYTAGREPENEDSPRIEAMWDTEPAPASFTVFGLPDLKTNHVTHYARCRFPTMLGLVATRSTDTPVAGHTPSWSPSHAKIRIRSMG